MKNYNHYNLNPPKDTIISYTPDEILEEMIDEHEQERKDFLFFDIFECEVFKYECRKAEFQF